MAHEIVERQPMRLIGMSVDCPGGDISGIGPLWERLMARWGEIAGAKGAWGADWPAGDGFCYLAGMEVDAAASVPEGFTAVAIPGGKYLKVPWRGVPKDMSAEMKRILYELIPALSLAVHPDCHCLEEYLPDGYDEQTGAFDTNLYVQLR